MDGKRERLRWGPDASIGAFLDALADAVFLHDLGGRILDVNAAACERLGWRREELLGRNVREIDSPEHAARVDSRMEEAFRRGGMVFQTVHRTRDGKDIPTEVNCRVIEYDGAPAVLSVARDISEHKKALDDLARRADELAALSRLGRCVGESLSTEAITTAALAELVSSIRLDVAMLYLAEGELLMLAGVHEAGRSGHVAAPETKKVGVCLCGLAARDRQAVYSADILADPRCTLTECKEAGMRSLAALPLMQGGDLLGVLAMASKTPRDFQASAPFLETLAGQVAAGLGNAVLHGRLRQHAGQLQRRLDELARADAALREQNAFRSAVIERAAEGLCVCRPIDEPPGVRFTVWNDRMVEITGYTMEQINRLGWWQTMYSDPAEQRRAAKGMAETWEGRDLRDEEREITRADGQKRTVSISTSALTDAEGRVHVLALMNDITGRKAAERALQGQRDLLSRVTETSPVGITVVGRDGRITFANRAAEEILALGRDELSRRTYRDVAWKITDEDGGPFPEEQLPFHRVRAEGRAVYDVRHAVEWPDGRRLVLSINAAPLRDEEGRFDGMVAALTDITRRRELEEQLRQAQKMEAVGRLAGGIAHDFNNQLTVIKGYCDLLLRSGGGGEEQQAEIAEIRAAAERAERLTRQLLAFSRKQALHPVVVNLNDVLKEMENPLARMIGEDINLAIVTDPTLGAVRVDRAQFQQAVMNLAVNARDAMPGGGRLTIETANVVLDETFAASHPDASPGPHVMLAVSDTGQGMDAATMQKIFEPFFTTKDAGAGTGLGLSMVYGFVRQSGGSVHVYSEPGFGATFKIYLPRVAADAAEQAPAAALEPVRGGSETVLVVEDDRPVRQVIVRALAGRGYTILAADGPAEALRLAEAHPEKIDLLITDVVMPGMNGPDLAEMLRATCGGLAVLYVSGYAENTIAHHGLGEEGMELLAKPFHPEDLARRVRRILDAAGRGPEN